jgi:cell division protein ZapA
VNDTAVSRVSVRILEKEYQFTCQPEERAALLDSAEYLNAEMRKIRDTGKVIGLDRIAVMAALNMANELLRLRTRAEGPGTEAVNRVRVLRERIESTLERGQQLEL